MGSRLPGRRLGCSPIGRHRPMARTAALHETRPPRDPRHCFASPFGADLRIRLRRRAWFGPCLLGGWASPGLGLDGTFPECPVEDGMYRRAGRLQRHSCQQFLGLVGQEALAEVVGMDVVAVRILSGGECVGEACRTCAEPVEASVANGIPANAARWRSESRPGIAWCAWSSFFSQWCNSTTGVLVCWKRWIKAERLSRVCEVFASLVW